MINPKCFSCGKKCDPDDDRCRGCNKIVCVSCAKKYDHYMNGKHGKKSKRKGR